MTSGSAVWRHRWFLLAVGFLLVNTYGVLRWARGPASTAAPAAGLVAFEGGAGGVFSNHVPLVWRFATDMVPAETVGEYRAGGPFTLTPPIDGKWIWDDLRTLRFQPDAPWPVGNRYTVHPGGPLVDQAGRAAPLPSVPDILTEPFRLVSISQVNRRHEGELTLRASFNAVPDRDEFARHVAIRDRHGAARRYHLLDAAASTNVFLSVPGRFRQPVTVHITRGLCPATGREGLAEDAAVTVPVTLEMALVRIEPISLGFQAAGLWLEFSMPPDPVQLGSFLTVEPAVDYLIEARDYACRLNGQFEPGQAYTVRVRAGLSSGQGPALTRDQQRIVRIPDRSAAAAIEGNGQYLSAAGSRQIQIKSTNLKRMELAAERVYPNNLVQFAMRSQGNYRGYYGMPYANEGISRLTGKLALPGGGIDNQVHTNQVDLTPLLGGYPAGAYHLTLSSDHRVHDGQLVVISDIGIAARRGRDSLLVWVNSLYTLTPLTGATVRVYSGANQLLGEGRTNGEGLWEYTQAGDDAPFLVSVEAGEDINYLVLDQARVSLPGDIGGRDYLRQGCEAYVFTDRGIYRPGETGRVHTVVRDRDLGLPDPFPVLLEAVQPDGRVFQRLPAELDASGTAGFDVAWPEFAPTGRYRLRLMVPGEDQALGSTAVAVEDFVPPSIAVDLQTAPDRLRAGEPLRFTVAAHHLFGAPAAHQPVTGRVLARRADIQPPGWEAYRFGDGEKEFSEADFSLGKQTLDAEGRADFVWTVPEDWSPPAGVNLLLVGTVTDTGGRTVTAFGSRPVDVYPGYLGIRMPKDSKDWPVNEPLPLDLAAVTPGGDAFQPAGPLRLTLHHVHWVTAVREENNRWVYDSARHLVPVHEEDVVIRDGRAAVRLALDQAGEYVINLADPATGASTSVPLYAYAEYAYDGAWSLERPDQVQLTLDRDGYPAGDTARLFIQAPFAGTALLTIESDRVLHRQILELSANSHQVEIPVLAAYQPNVYCGLTVLRPVVAEEIWSPHRAVGVVPLRVHDPAEQLAVTVTAPEVIRPLSRLQVDLAVRDHAGAPVPAQVVLAAVDEGICRLTDFRTPDPLGFFRSQRALGVAHCDLYGLLLPELAEELAGTPSSPGGDMMGLVRGRLNPIRARRFRPTALWSGPVMAGPDGTASIALDVPEFTGELRLMAVAIGERAFGHATGRSAVKRPLVVQSGLPRFLAPGDRCAMPVRVFNQTGGAVEARVSVLGNELVAVSPAEPAVVSLADGADAIVPFDLLAVGGAGVATVTVAVAGGGETHVESIELPVRPAAPRATRAAAGVVHPGETAHLDAPGDWIAGTGARRLRCAGVPTLQFAGGLDYLLRYPYGCVEQTTSSAFPLLYLPDLAAWLLPDSITRDDVASFVNDGIFELWAMQRPGGGFGYWGYRSDLDPWGSLYATHFLVEAKRAGFDVDEARLASALGYVEGILDDRSPETDEDAEAWRIDRNQRAYACQVLALAGRPQPNWAARLREEAPTLSTSARCHLAAALALDNRRVDAAALLGELGPGGGATATPAINPTRESPARELALRLVAWLLIDPQHPEVSMLARRLNEGNQGGRWHTTQENAMALLALGQFSRHRQDEPVGFRATAAWADGAETHAFTHEAPVDFAPGDQDRVELTNQGPGPLYYYDSRSGVPADGAIARVDQGLSVRRTLLDREGSEFAGTRIPRGELVIVRLTVTTGESAVDDVVIEDLLPAGLEIENPRLETTEQLPTGVSRADLLPIRHADARDDRMLVFSDKFTGTRQYYYAARAVTEGTYVLPPVLAEAMYEPALRSVHGDGAIEVTP